MTCMRIASLALLACLLALSATAGEKGKGAKPAQHLPGWGEASDPDRDCDVTLVKGKVVVKVPGKAHDFAADIQRWNAPRILSPVKGDCIVEVKVCGELKPAATSTIDGRRLYHGAGLLLVKDDDNYISLHRGAVYINDSVRHYANFELRKGGQLTVSRFEVDLDAQDTYLRVERRGDKFYALASHDGVHWKVYDEPIEAELSEELRVGVVVVSSSDQPLACTFEGLAIFCKGAAASPKP
jgi:regulation of enolase protein 1 (concanavalin A-like superfamily)